MNYKFEQGEIVQFDDEKFGKGTGGIVGYPKVEHDYNDYPFMCLVIKSNKLISTPF